VVLAIEETESDIAIPANIRKRSPTFGGLKCA
jgi:hypothetical protein